MRSKDGDVVLVIVAVVVDVFLIAIVVVVLLFHCEPGKEEMGGQSPCCDPLPRRLHVRSQHSELVQSFLEDGLYITSTFFCTACLGKAFQVIG